MESLGSLQCSEQRVLGIFRGIYFWWLFRTLLTKPPFHCETTLPPSGRVRHCTNSRLPDETALKDRLLCFFSLLRNDHSSLLE